MIKLSDLSYRAKEILEEVKPYRDNWEHPEFVRLYSEFLEETDCKYSQYRYDGFQVASVNYQRKAGFKAETLMDMERKVIDKNALELKQEILKNIKEDCE